MPILESPPIPLSIGVTVQPILNHGKPGWRIFRPDGTYITQWSAEAAARTAMRWSGKQASVEAVKAEIAGYAAMISIPTSLPRLE